MKPKQLESIFSAFVLWAAWTLATWFLEGRIGTFVRPEAVADRLAYTVAANITVGIIGSAVFLAQFLRRNTVSRTHIGFGSPVRTLVWVPVGFALGLGLYFGQGAPSTNAMVILNAYAQVFVVSIAEVVVCWAVVGSTMSAVIVGSKWIGILGAATVASVLFGVYHFAHSPPFNTIQMVGFLTIIGLLTSAFFFLSRDVYATIAFHNFLGVFGVVQALAAQGNLEAFKSPQVPLLATAAGTLIVLLLCDIFVIRRAGS